MTESPTAATISNNDNNTRHFKFVGGPSRKRRRHNRHGEMLIDFGNNNSNKSRASFRRPLRVTGAQEAVGGEGEGKGGSQSKSPVREEAEVGEGDSNSAWAPPPSSHDAAFGEVMPQQQQQQQQQQGLWDEAAAIAPLMLTQGLMSDGMTLGDVMGLWPTGNDGPSMESPAGAGALDGVVDASHLFSGGQLPFMLPDQTPALHIPLPTVSTATAPASHASFNTEQHDINEGGSGSFSRMASPTLMRPSDNSTVIAKLFTRCTRNYSSFPLLPSPLPFHPLSSPPTREKIHLTRSRTKEKANSRGSSHPPKKTIKNSASCPSPATSRPTRSGSGPSRARTCSATASSPCATGTCTARRGAAWARRRRTGTGPWPCSDGRTTPTTTMAAAAVRKGLV